MTDGGQVVDGANTGAASGVGDGQAGGAGDATPEAKYSDADLNKYKGTARKDGRQAAFNELLSKAEGAQSIDDLIAAWEEKRTIEEATKGETEREREARLTAEQERDKYRSLADTRLVDSELRLELLNAGVPSDRVKAAAKLVDRDGIKVDNGAVTGLEDAVSTAVDSMPWLMADGGAAQQTYRAADTSPAPVNSGDPQEAMGSFLNQVLNGP